jgi:hypothetical protein
MIGGTAQPIVIQTAPIQARKRHVSSQITTCGLLSIDVPYLLDSFPKFFVVHDQVLSLKNQNSTVNYFFVIYDPCGLKKDKGE